MQLANATFCRLLFAQCTLNEYEFTHFAEYMLHIKQPWLIIIRT